MATQTQEVIKKPSQIISKFYEEIQRECASDKLGMILFHCGIVRGTSKNGEKIVRMKVSYDERMLDKVISKFLKREGICSIKVWINEGILEIGDPIMIVGVGGRYRTDVLPVFESLLKEIKTQVVREEEIKDEEV